MKTVWLEKGLKEYNTRCAFQIKCNKATKIELVAKDFYQLFIDGEFVGYGPSKTDMSYVRKDVYDLSNYENFVLTVEVLCYNITSYSVCSQNPLFGAQLYDGDCVIANTDDFVAYEVGDYIQKVQKYSLQRGFSENYVMEIDRSAFYNGQNVFKQAKTVEVATPTILERSTKYPKFNLINCKKVDSGNIIVDKNLPHWVEEEQMTNDPTQNLCFERDEICEFVSDTVSEFLYSSNEIRNNMLCEKQYFTYDFERIVTGLFSIDLNVVEDAEIYFTWSELAKEDDGQLNFDFSRNTCCDIIKYSLKKGDYNLLSFEPYCGRYCRVIVLKGCVDVKNVGMRLVENPMADNFKFECVNKNLELVVEAAKNTFAQNAVDIFYDCPGRERAGWLCDGYFMGKAETLICGNNLVERDYLENFILFSDIERYPDGIIPMCYPSKITNKKYIPNWAMWFIIELGDYYKRTGDIALIEKAKDRCYGILHFFDKFLNEFGLLEDLKSWVFVEWSKANDFVNGVNVPSNIIYSQALKVVGELYEDYNMISKANSVKETVKEMFFNGEFFIDNAVRDENGKLKLTQNTSETCQYYALYFDFAKEEKYSAFKEKMINNFGYFRDDKVVYPSVYKSNAFIGNFLRFAYLFKDGRYKKLLDECEEYLTPMARKSKTLWEHSSDWSSLNHGFASFSTCLIVESLKKSNEYKFNCSIVK